MDDLNYFDNDSGTSSRQTESSSDDQILIYDMDGTASSPTVVEEKLETVKIINNDLMMGIVSDICLIDFHDKRRNHVELFDLGYLDKLNSNIMNEYDLNIDIETIPICSTPNNQFVAHVFMIEKIEEYLKRNRQVKNILDKGKGKLSVCGIELFDMQSETYNFYFHSCTVDEANNILRKCFNYIGNNLYSVQYVRSQFTDTMITNTDKHKYIFHRKIYETKDQIFLDIPFAPNRHGWNPIDKYFTTCSAAFSHAMGLFPINLSNKTHTFWQELVDFNEDRGFDIIFPGLSLTPDTVVTPDGTITRYEDFNIISNKNYKFPDANIVCISTNHEHDVAFQSNQYLGIKMLDKGMVEANIATYKWKICDNITELPNIPLSQIKLFLGNDCEQYLTNLFTNRNVSHKIWNDRIDYCVNRGYEIAQKIKDDLWNQNSIKPSCNPRDWYGVHYQSFQVGLQDDRFVQFYQCAIQYNIPKDIFNILCTYWFLAEVSDAKDRLSIYSSN